MDTKTNLLSEMTWLRDVAGRMVKAIEAEDWDAAYDCGAAMCCIDIIGTEQQIQELQEAE